MSACIPDVIIIRGAPGAGKSITSKGLAAHFPKGARIEVDSLRGMVISVDWTNQEEHISILDLAMDVVRGFHARGFKPVIVVDTFSGDKITKFHNDLLQHGSPLDVRSFALVAAPEVLKSRIESRTEDRFKDVDVCQKINADVIRYHLPTEQLIDNTAMTPEEAVGVILGAIGVARTTAPLC